PIVEATEPHDHQILRRHDHDELPLVPLRDEQIARPRLRQRPVRLAAAGFGRGPEPGAVDVAVGRRRLLARVVAPALRQDGPRSWTTRKRAQARAVAYTNAEPTKVPAASNSGCAERIPMGPNSSSCSTAARRTRRSAGRPSGANTRPSASAMRLMPAEL